MTNEKGEIRSFDLKNANDEEYEQLTRLHNIIRKEAMPDDPATSMEQTRAELQNIPPVFSYELWVARNGRGEIIAEGSVAIPRMETNQHLAQFDIRVLPEHRQKGLAKRFLENVTEESRREDRSLLIGNTRSTIPAGEAFMKAMGANVGLATHVNELKIEDLNRQLLAVWIDRSKERAKGIEFGLWEGRYPEDQLEAIAKMRELMNTMPKDDLEIEDFRWDADQIRQIDDSMEATGDIRWTMYARDQASGRLVGYSDMYWNAHKPKIAQQGDTAVLEEFQNRGIGRWLKASMLEKLLREHPEVKLVRTGNAQSNAPMLKINEELGFRPSMTQLLWQVKTDEVVSYLKNQALSTAP